MIINLEEYKHAKDKIKEANMLYMTILDQVMKQIDETAHEYSTSINGVRVVDHRRFNKFIKRFRNDIMLYLEKHTETKYDPNYFKWK